ncbi:MAG: ClbS/DfsB family four-helix bundle protein [Anaerolineae bacterium]|nr:ClbS/DfsB family four-helix bundle protein [Anaerolineae bacterium]
MVQSQVMHHLATEFGPGDDVSMGQWFGNPCLKAGKRVFAVLWEEDVAFKLSARAREEALHTAGAHLFDPQGKGSPMKQWVQVPADQSTTWVHFARLAREHVAGIAQAAKDEIISRLVESRRQLVEAILSLSRDQRNKVFLGSWSALEVVAHLVGWDYTNLDAVQAILAGERPRFWDHYDRDWATYNAQLVAQYGQEDWASLVFSVQESHQTLIRFLESVPPDEYIKTTKIRTLLRAEAKDEDVHREQVKALKEGAPD